MILAAFDVIHHAVELDTPLNGLARFSGILIFADNFIVVELSIGFHPVFLSFKRIAINLHGGGHAGIQIYLRSFLHRLLQSPAAEFLTFSAAGLDRNCNNIISRCFGWSNGVFGHRYFIRMKVSLVSLLMKRWAAQRTGVFAN